MMSDTITSATSQSMARPINRAGLPAPRQRSQTSAASTSAVLPVGSSIEADISPVWIRVVTERIRDLSQRGPGWDSYGARPLTQSAVDQLYNFVRLHGRAIQGAPALSLTTEGGLLASWERGPRVLEVTFHPVEQPFVAFEDSSDGLVQEAEVGDVRNLRQLLWLTSASRS